MWPDVESVLLDLLASLTSSDQVGTVTPSDLESKLPFIRVVRYGGTDDGITDQAPVDVDCFASTRAAAIELAEQVRQLLIVGSHVVDAVVLDRAVTVVAPAQRPTDNPRLRRFGGTYQVSTRRTV